MNFKDSGTGPFGGTGGTGAGGGTGGTGGTGATGGTGGIGPLRTYIGSFTSSTIPAGISQQGGGVSHNTVTLDVTCGVTTMNAVGLGQGAEDRILSGGITIKKLVGAVETEYDILENAALDLRTWETEVRNLAMPLGITWDYDVTILCADNPDPITGLFTIGG